MYRVCRKHGIFAKRNYLKGLTKAAKDAYKNDNLLHGDFHADEPNQKLITDITQLPTKDGTLYSSGVFDCYNKQCVGLSMAEHMRTSLVIESFAMTIGTYSVHGAFCHSDRGSQYTGHEFREYAQAAGFVQSMSFAGSSCYGNAKCESMWARMKEEAIYGSIKKQQRSGIENPADLFYNEEDQCLYVLDNGNYRVQILSEDLEFKKEISISRMKELDIFT